MAVSFSDIQLAFEFVSSGGMGENEAYLDRQSGKIYWHSEFGENDEELPDDIDNEKYIAIPDRRELDLGKPLVLEFAREFLPDDYEEVRHIFNVDVFSDEAVNAAGPLVTLRRQRGSARSARAGYGRRWLAVAAAALVTGVYAAQVVVPAADTSPAPIAGIAPSYGPKTVSAMPNAYGHGSKFICSLSGRFKPKNIPMHRPFKFVK
jgi:hypothetical protein